MLLDTFYHFPLNISQGASNLQTVLNLCFWRHRDLAAANGRKKVLARRYVTALCSNLAILSVTAICSCVEGAKGSNFLCV